MGGHSYSHSRRAAITDSYAKMDFSQQFTQQDKGEMHESMDPKGIIIRECRDNEHNPLTLPIALGLDVTGSMQDIPRLLIGHGLPDMVKKLHERGIQDPSILFMGLGDSKNDRAPFQVGQFECEDTLLDQWLRRTWIEGNGGGNGGESYLWAWWLAAFKTATDAWDKRKQKGFLFTVGNEPCHPTLEPYEFEKVLGVKDEGTDMTKLHKIASEKWNIYHLCINNRSDSCPSWKEFLGENAIEVSDFKQIPNIISDIVAKNVRVTTTTPAAKPDVPGVGGEDFKVTL